MNNDEGTIILCQFSHLSPHFISPFHLFPCSISSLSTMLVTNKHRIYQYLSHQFTHATPHHHPPQIRSSSNICADHTIRLPQYVLEQSTTMDVNSGQFLHNESVIMIVVVVVVVCPCWRCVCWRFLFSIDYDKCQGCKFFDFEAMDAGTNFIAWKDCVLLVVLSKSVES